MDRPGRQGGKRYEMMKANQENYLRHMNQMILTDDDFEFSHVPALAQRLDIYKEKFIEFDKDYSGDIGFSEFKKMLERLEETKTHVQCKRLFNRCNKSQQPGINYKDFVDMLLGNTLGLGIAFEKEQDIMDQLELSRNNRQPNPVKRMAPPPPVGFNHVEAKEEDSDEDVDDVAEDDDNDDEDSSEDDDDRHEEEAVLPQGEVEQSEHDDDNDSLPSYRSIYDDEQEQEDEDDQEEEDTEEEVDEEEDDEGEEEEEEGEDEEEDEEVEEEDEDDAEDTVSVVDERQEDERKVVERTFTDVTRSLEHNLVLRSEAPVGQAQPHQQSQSYGVVPGRPSTDQPPARTYVNNNAALVPVNDARLQRPAPQTIPASAQPSSAVRAMQTNPPPAVCSTHSLPPEARYATKGTPRQVSPVPFSYICTDPACPDSHPQTQQQYSQGPQVHIQSDIQPAQRQFGQPSYQAAPMQKQQHSFVAANAYQAPTNQKLPTSYNAGSAQRYLNANQLQPQPQAQPEMYQQPQPQPQQAVYTSIPRQQIQNNPADIPMASYAQYPYVLEETRQQPAAYVTQEQPGYMPQVQNDYDNQMGYVIRTSDGYVMQY